MNLLSTAGLAEEMSHANFRDHRLCARLETMVNKLAPNPERSFPKAFTSSELEGAYRFFGNPQVTPDGILGGHYAATRERARTERCVLALHDTTTCTFRADGQREGLGRLMKASQTFFAHCTLLVTDDGSRTPLGVVALTPWARHGEPDGSERARWGNHVALTSERLEGAAECIHVMDREADDYV